MLYLDDDNAVRISREAMTLPVVLNLLDLDKETKGFSDKAIAFIYHAYSREHMLAFLPARLRADKVFKMYLPGENPDNFINNPIVQVLVEFYRKHTYSESEFFIESIKTDMLDTAESIREMPMKIKHKVTVQVEIPGENGDPVKVPHKTTVLIDNSKEKFDAFTRADKLMDLLEKWNNRVKKEKMDRKKNPGGRLFEERK